MGHRWGGGPPGRGSRELGARLGWEAVHKPRHVSGHLCSPLRNLSTVCGEWEPGESIGVSLGCLRRPECVVCVHVSELACVHVY